MVGDCREIEWGTPKSTIAQIQLSLRYAGEEHGIPPRLQFISCSSLMSLGFSYFGLSFRLSSAAFGLDFP